tara:strand:+ start:4692 stop:5003 length:312 start_codon:yes stop_codon:yes gene_type:complete
MSELSQNKSTVQSTPSDATLQHCCKLSIMEDKPIMLDYWNDSTENKALIGVKNNEEQEKILIKNEDEYTSPISKIYKTEKEYIIITENSIYIVANSIATKRVS